MRTIKQILFPAFAAVVAGLAVCIPASGELQWPIQQSQVTANLGDQRAIVEFPFRNTGDSSITVTDVKTSCGCTTAKLDKKVYAPGEEGVIRAELTFGNRHDWQEKKIVVLTDESDAKPTVLRMRVYIPPTITKNPLTLQWLAGEKPGEKTLRIRVVRPEPFRIIKVLPDNPNFHAKLVTVIDGREYRLTVIPDRTDKPIETTLRLTTDLIPDEGKEPVILKTTASVVAPKNPTTTAAKSTPPAPELTTPKPADPDVAVLVREDGPSNPPLTAKSPSKQSDDQ